MAGARSLWPARVSDATAAEAGIDTDDPVDPPSKGRLPIRGRLLAGRARILEHLYTSMKRRNNFGRLTKATRTVIEQGEKFLRHVPPAQAPW